jgi:hypothetical protein
MKQRPGAAHRTSTQISARGGTTVKRATRTLDEGSGGEETCSGLETFPESGRSAESCKIDTTLSFASTTRFSLGSIIRTCLFIKWQPRMHSAAKLVTTTNRDWTRIVPNCTCIVITPRWRSGRPPAPMIWYAGVPGRRLRSQSSGDISSRMVEIFDFEACLRVSEFRFTRGSALYRE